MEYIFRESNETSMLNSAEEGLLGPCGLPFRGANERAPAADRRKDLLSGPAQGVEAASAFSTVDLLSMAFLYGRARALNGPFR